MDNIYVKGELLRVCKSNDEIVEGRFHGITTDKSRISLYDVKFSPADEPTKGLSHYYGTEVREIIKMQDPEELAENLMKTLKLPQKEIEEISKISKMYIFINQVDKNFHDAIEDLNSFGFIGLGTEGASMGRKCKLPFMTMSTPKQIYIFDIQVMQFHAFDAGIKEILESDHPKKIVHNSRQISDCMFHKHNVSLKSVFDTQVADLIITRNKTGHLSSQAKSLKECMNSYLGLPVTAIDEELNIVKCTERPLSVDIKDTLAKNIAYLHRLSEVVHDELMLPFERGVECYLNHLRACDDFKSWQLCSQNNKVPKEFKNAIDY